MHRLLTRIAAPAAVAALLALATATALADPGDVIPLQEDLDPSGNSMSPSSSSNGTIVAFASNSTDLDDFTPDTNAARDIFRRKFDEDAFAIRDSFIDGEHAGSANQANQGSFAPDLGDDNIGPNVVFDSDADNLIGAGNDTNGAADVFLRVPETEDTIRLSLDVGGGQTDGDSFNADMGADESVVAYETDSTDSITTDAGGHRDIILSTGGAGGNNVLQSVNSAGDQGNGDSRNAAVPDAESFGDATGVAFESDADNLLGAGNDTNGHTDVFVHEPTPLPNGHTEQISVDTAEAEQNGDSTMPAISADGNWVAFLSTAPLAAGGTAGSRGVFVRDRSAGTTQRVDVTYDGSLSEGTTGLDPDMLQDAPSISADGRYVAFSSTEDRLVPGDTNGVQDVFVRDLQLGRTIRVDVPQAGGQASARSAAPSISDDGTHVAFATLDDGLVPGDVSDPYWELLSIEATDWTAPDTTITGGPPATAFPGRVAMTLHSTEDASTFQCRVDAGSFAPCPADYVTPPLGVGTHTVQARAADRFGNFDSTPGSATVKVVGRPAAPGGPTTNQPPPPPTPIFEKSIVVEPVRGKVLVKVPGSKKYVPIESLESIPEGSIIDARKGRIKIISAKSRKGGKQSAVFYAGVFKVTYESGNVTQLTLRGKVGPCPTAGSKKAQAARKRKRRRRRLWGNGHGRFRTRGRHSAATVRGTWWLTEDRCDGTLTLVKRGKVRVKDFRRHKTVTVKAHHRYLARAHKRRKR